MAGTIVIVIAGTAQFAFRARSLEFSHVDDYQGYMLFPLKMLQTGALGEDPYSEHRLVTALGGKYWVDAMVLSRTSLKSLSGAYSSLGLALFLLSLIGLCRGLGLGAAPTLGVAGLGLLVGAPVVNLTAVILGVPFFLALHAVLARAVPAGFSLPRALATAMVLGGLRHRL